MDSLNTIYIISKGRPGCKTARVLEAMDYPGEWFIVCGNNDETLVEYEQIWGDKVLVFDWYDEITRTDTLDNFGFGSKPSGAVPARNATCRIARERGEKRHWQLDDDYNGFYKTNSDCKTKHRMDGVEFYDCLLELAEFADKCKLSNVGISLGTKESIPAKAKRFGRRVFNAHNLPTDPSIYEPWRGRMNDDLINAIDVWRHGGYEMQFRHVAISMEPTQSSTGGLADLYESDGTVRKTAYAVIVAPNAVKLDIKFGRYHHQANWDRITPKLLHEKFRKEG